MSARPHPYQIYIDHRPAAWHTLRYGLAGLWLLDGLLQMQPRMFTMDMISTIMQPVANGEPSWLHNLISWSIQVVTPHLVAFNWTVVAIQLVIGLMLLGPWPRVMRSGLWLSIIWSALVWLFGEGLGQLLTGSATFLTGAPGSVFFYGVAGGLLLWSIRMEGRVPPSRPTGHSGGGAQSVAGSGPAVGACFLDQPRLGGADHLRCHDAAARLVACAD